jgi:hypothetical protein
MGVDRETVRSIAALRRTIQICWGVITECSVRLAVAGAGLSLAHSYFARPALRAAGLS